MKGEAFQITVPGSTANLGPGFDSIGMAINRHLVLQVELSNDWEFIPLTEEVKDIPLGKDNLIYKIAANVAESYHKQLPSCKVKMSSNIPLARGLGSSAAAIVAAIELVNELCELNISQAEKLRLASQFEGHPDNVGASIYGGIIVGSHRGDDTNIVQIPEIDLDIVVAIPRYEVKTKDARAVLPDSFTLSKAVEASSISNVLVAALFTSNLPLAGKMMDLDLFHQPYRKVLIKELEDIHTVAKQSGAFGVALSGAGPTVICFAEKGKGNKIKKNLAPIFAHLEVEELEIEYKGSAVTTFAY